MEANLNYVEEFSAKAMDALGAEETLSSEIISRALGRILAEDAQGHGVLRSAFLKKVPVYVPAFTDSELGLDLSTWAMRHAKRRGLERALDVFDARPRYNPYLDLNSFTRSALGAKRLGIFTIGGGVPRNWAQQVGPYVDVRNVRLGMSQPPVRFSYGVRICPDPVHYGHLSGCTYSEGVSWGNFVSPADGGRFAEVLLEGVRSGCAQVGAAAAARGPALRRVRAAARIPAGEESSHGPTRPPRRAGSRLEWTARRAETGDAGPPACADRNAGTHPEVGGRWLAGNPEKPVPRWG